MSDMSSRRGRVLGTEPVGVGRTLVRTGCRSWSCRGTRSICGPCPTAQGTFSRSYSRHEPMPAHVAAKVQEAAADEK